MVIRYSDAKEAKPGDLVDVDGTLSVVVDVVGVGHVLLTSGTVARPGLMLCSEQMGHVYQEMDSAGWEDVVLISRGTPADRLIVPDGG